MNTQNLKTSSASFSPAAATLWASAFVVAALTIVQAGRLSGSTANAEMAVDRGSYTLMTCNSGNGGDADPNELLYVIDSREQTLLVYEVEDARKKQVILRDGGSLDNLFIKAKQ